MGDSRNVSVSESKTFDLWDFLNNSQLTLYVTAVGATRVTLQITNRRFHKVFETELTGPTIRETIDSLLKELNRVLMPSQTLNLPPLEKIYLNDNSNQMVCRLSELHLIATRLKTSLYYTTGSTGEIITLADTVLPTFDNNPFRYDSTQGQSQLKEATDVLCHPLLCTKSGIEINSIVSLSTF